MRCIIFVERKIATLVLANLLSDIKALSLGFRFQSLAGKGVGLNVMNCKVHQDVVEAFGDVRLVFWCGCYQILPISARASFLGNDLMS